MQPQSDNPLQRASEALKYVTPAPSSLASVATTLRVSTSLPVLQRSTPNTRHDPTARDSRQQSSVLSLRRRGSVRFESDENGPNQSQTRTHSPSGSVWIDRYKDQAKSEFLSQDISEMLHHFEDLNTSTRTRKPLNASLLVKHAASSSFAGLPDDADDPTIARDSSNKTVADKATDSYTVPDDGYGEHLRTGGGVVMIPGAPAARLRRQATKLMIQKRAISTTAAEVLKRQQFAEKIVPTRFLFDATRWQRSTRCDYCQLAGGDLECATCDVVAHAPCFLTAYESTTRKTKGAFVVPTRFSWLCQHCQVSLQDEYDERAKKARSDYIANQKNVFGKVVKAYVRMTRDALTFKKKKEAIVKIQAILRGRLARVRFNRLQRMRLKPYAIHGLKLHGFRRHVDLLSLGADGTVNLEDLRLANGFTCNPYVYVTVVDGDDDDSQFFCFETSVVRKVLATESEITWKNDRLFVPGVNGNVTLCFTLLSKNGPNNFMLGQGILRLRDSDTLWRCGASVDLVLSQEVEILPRTAQHQALRLVDAAPTLASRAAMSNRHGLGSSSQQPALDPVFANGSSVALRLSVHVQPYSEVHSHCGYLLSKNTLDSFQTSQRWCVLADGVLRVYRHYGVTLATDTVEMAHTIELKLVETKNVHREEQWIAMEHMTRLYIFQSERGRPATKQWLKKLQAATRFGTATTAGTTQPGSTVSLT